MKQLLSDSRQVYLQQLMNHQLPIVSAEVPLREVVALMQDKGRNELFHTTWAEVLVIENSQLIGRVTEHRLVQFMAEAMAVGKSPTSWDEIPVSVVMLPGPIVLAVEDFQDIFVAVEVMQKSALTSLPLVDRRGMPVGMITAANVIAELPSGLLRTQSVGEVASLEMGCAAPTTPISQGIDLLLQSSSKGVIIVDRGSNGSPTRDPLGLLTARDVLQLWGKNLDLTQVQAQVIMATPPTIQRGDSLERACQMMQEFGVASLLVTDAEGTPEGVLTPPDLLKLLTPSRLCRALERSHHQLARVEQEKQVLLDQPSTDRAAELQRINDLLHQEITHRREVEHELRESQVCLQLINTIATGRALGFTVAQVIERVLASIHRLFHRLRVSYATLDSQNQLRYLQSIAPPELPTLVGDNAFDLNLVPECLAMLQAGEPVFFEDALKDPQLLPLLEQLLTTGTRAGLAVPLKNQQGLVGVLSLGSVQPRVWSEYEIATLVEIADYLSFTLQEAYAQEERKRAEAALQQLNAELEQRVNQRTIELARTVEQLHREINDREQAEQALQKSQQFVQRIADSNPNILYIYDLVERRNVYINREIYPILGYTPEEIQKLGSNLMLELIHPDDLLRVTQHQIQLATDPDGPIRDVEYRVRKAGGNWCWLQSRDTVFSRDSNGRVRQIIGSAQDITKRRQAEAALQQQMELDRLVVAISHRIRESLELETILNTTVNEVRQLLQVDRVLVYHLEAEGQGRAIAEAVDPHWRSILNTQFSSEVFPEDCYGRYINGRIYALEDRDNGQVLPCLAQFMQDFEVRAKLVVPIIQQDRLWGLLIAHHCADSRRWQVWEISLLQQLANQLAIAIKQSELYQRLQVELEERQKAEAQLQETNHRLAEANTDLARATRLKDEFLASMSHELRTPLNAILGMAEGLTEEIYGSLTHRQRRSVATIERSGKHLLELINDILDLSKIESGKLELQILPVSLRQLCESSLTFVRQQALKKRIHLTANLPSEPRHIEVDERRMCQVLINLLSNAVKFTPEGGSVSLTVRLEESTDNEPAIGDREGESFPSQPCSPDSCLVFSVSDTGIGIAPEDFDKLFKPFVQIDSSLSRKHSGTGLGLALVRRIVDMHGGCTSFTSTPGQGSCFTVHVPHRQNRTIDASGSAATAETTQITWDFRSAEGHRSPEVPDLELQNTGEKLPTILLAEDNETNIATLAGYLQGQGYRLVIARNGLAAVTLVRAEAPDLILMDIQMPEMDGLAAIELLRSDPTLAPIPIIALTALAMPGDRERCLKAGANEYLTKPVSLRHLQQQMERLLQSQGENSQK